MIVVDASAVVNAVLGHAPLRARMRPEYLAAPEIVELETLNTIRKMEFHGLLAAVGAEDAYRAARLLAVEPYPHAPLLPRTWQLRDRLSAYDASYLALAEALDVPLITCDRALARVAGVRAEYFDPAGYHRPG